MTFTNAAHGADAGPTTLLPVNEKTEALNTSSNCSVHCCRRKRVYAFFSSSNMPSSRILFRNVLITLFAAVWFTLGYAAVAGSHPAESRQGDFHELLSSVSDKSLHSVLHEHIPKKYQHGVFQEDRQAIEAVHKDDAAMATSLIELARRQALNSTAVVTATSSVAAATTSVVVVVSSSSASSAPSTSAAASSSAAETTTASSSSSTAPQSTTSSSPKQTSLVTSTVAASPTKTSTPAGSVDTTVAPGGSETSEVVYTTTLPNGSRSTVTALTVVAGQDAASPTATATATKEPSLQSGGAVSLGRGANIAGGVAAGMVGLMGLL